MNKQEFPSKYYDAIVPEVFNFLSDLASGETITSAVVTNTVYSGSDPFPTVMLSGSPVINGPQVTQLVRGGRNGVLYILSCAAITSLSHTLSKQGYLAILDHTS